jgi:hypothetical protein
MHFLSLRGKYEGRRNTGCSSVDAGAIELMCLEIFESHIEFFQVFFNFISSYLFGISSYLE